MVFVESSPLADHLGFVDFGSLNVLRPLLDKLNVAQIIDRHIPTEADISHGVVLDILLAARLQSPTALVHVARWAQEHGVEYLWNVPCEKLNDDRIARALDAFFEKRHQILADITHEVLRVTQLTLDRCHFDTTHIVLYGSYEPSHARPISQLETLVNDVRDNPAHITHGYLTRYKMLQLGLTSVVDDLGAVPVACHLFDGNRNGHTGIREQYHLLRNSLNLPQDFLLVSDRGTCSAEHFGRLLRHGHHAICAAQWQDYACLYEQHAQRLCWQKASYLSREQQRRRAVNSSLPLDDYELAAIDHSLIDPTTKQPFDCRVIFVRSSAAKREAQKRRAENIVKIKAGLEAIAVKLRTAHPCTTAESVARQIQRLLGKKSAARHFRYQLVPLTESEIEALPPPKKGYRKQSHRLEYSYDEASALAESERDGIYVLVSTAPKSHSADELFTEYKRQTYVEREHHELKTPIAVAPIFLKTPHRVEALVSLLFVALQAYMTLERLYRQRVPEGAPQSEHRMTAEKILGMFNRCGVTIERREYGEVITATRLTPQQRGALIKMSLQTPQQILTKMLSPPPAS